MPFDLYFADYSGEEPRDAKKDFDTLAEAEAFVVEELKGQERSEQGGTILFKVPVPGGSSFYTVWIEERGFKQSKDDRLILMQCDVEGHGSFISSVNYCRAQGGIKNVCPDCVAGSTLDQSHTEPGAVDGGQTDPPQ